MNKQILLIQPGVETLKFFSERLAEQFLALGYETHLICIHEPFPSLDKLCKLLEKKDTVLVTFNFHALQKEAIFYTSFGESVWDLFSVFCINIIVDHPFYYYEELMTLPKRYLQICIDEDHADYMRRFYPTIELGSTMPLAGCRYREDFPFQKKNAELPDISEIPPLCNSDASRLFPLPAIKDRTRDVIFCGCLTDPDFFLPYMNRNGEEYRVFYQGILDELLEHPDSCIHTVYLKHLNRELPDLNDADLKNVMNKMIFLDLWIRFTFRGKAIRSLVDAGIPVHCIGAGWETLRCKNKNLLTQSGYSDTAVCLRAMTTAKLSLNVMPWFKRGAHDRIYSSMQNGAVCVTDTSEYLTAHFREGELLTYYRLSEIERLPQIVDSLLSNPDKMQEIADRAAAYSLRNLSWDNYAKQLTQYFG